MVPMPSTQGTGVVVDPLYVDPVEVRIWLRAGRLVHIAFRSFRSPGAVVAAGVLAMLVRGRTIDVAKELTQAHVANVMGGPPHGTGSSISLGVRGLKAAIADWEHRQTGSVATANERGLGIESAAGQSAARGTEPVLADTS